MGTRGEARRDKILDVAQALVLQNGFTGTSIEQIIDHSAITKGGFFYHFKGKNDLARELMERYLAQDEVFFRTLFERADTLSEDPLQQMLIFLKLFSEAMADLKDTHPGCLVASYTYESLQFDDEVKKIAKEGVLNWQRMFGDRFSIIAEKYPAKLSVEAEQLADMLTAVIEGGIIVSRVYGNPAVLVDQLHQFRNHVRLLFGDT